VTGVDLSAVQIPSCEVRRCNSTLWKASTSPRSSASGHQMG
jgi:hypothetical protein